MSEEQKEKKEETKPEFDFGDLMTKAGIKKGLFIAWFEDGSYRQTTHNLNHIELVGLARMLEHDAIDKTKQDANK